MTYELPWGAVSASLSAGRSGLDEHETEWMERFNRTGIAGDMDVCLSLLETCPLSLTRTRVFAIVAGALFGRAVALSASARAERRQGLRLLYTIASRWTILDPEACGLLLETMSPEVLYAITMLWPDRYHEHRYFFCAVLWGMHNEGFEGTEFLNRNGFLANVRHVLQEALCPEDEGQDESRDMPESEGDHEEGHEKSQRKALQTVPVTDMGERRQEGAHEADAEPEAEPGSALWADSAAGSRGRHERARD